MASIKNVKKYNIPNRVYMDGEKTMFSIRTPNKLLVELEAIAKLKGWKSSDLILTILDQFVQQEKKQTSTK